MWEQRKRVLGSVRRFVGAVGGLGGCETDAVMALDLGGMSVVLWGWKRSGGGTMMIVMGVRIDWWWERRWVT